MNCGDILVGILEKSGVDTIFGHPGEQIMPFYESLRKSNINHILMRHEQGAAHAADGYARSSGNIGVCVATAGPGALNFVMGVATAFKDSVPMIIITGDVPTNLKGKNTFQDAELNNVFKSITIKTYNPQNPEEAVLNFVEAIQHLKKGPQGPIHINLPKDIIGMDIKDVDKKGKIKTQYKTKYTPNYDYFDLNHAIDVFKQAHSPLIIAGAGIIWGKCEDKLKRLVKQGNIPIATTYHLTGMFDKNDPLFLGLIGSRGSERANYAYKNADVILALGTRLSEKTIDEDLKINQDANTTLIHINTKISDLRGDININGDVNVLLDNLIPLNPYCSPDWVNNVNKQRQLDLRERETLISPESNELSSFLLKPQVAINTILEKSKDLYVVGDAGGHTTWLAMLGKYNPPKQLIFTGGMGSMGYGLPAAIGVASKHKREPIIMIAGDGSFQMTLQELATVKEYKLPIIICIINNFQLGIIRQWQETFYGGKYQVDLENPDFVEIAKAYGIEAVTAGSNETLKEALEVAIELKEPYLIDIVVNEEDIPLPDSILFNRSD